MRHVAALALLLVAAGCGGDGETTIVTVTETVAGESAAPPALPTPLPADGTLPVEEFEAYLGEVDEPWELDVAAVLGVFVDAGATEASNRSFEATVRGEGSSATATLVLDGLFDDSIRALRYDAELRRRSTRTWELVSATWAQRCRAGRGHEDFSAEPCL